MNKDTIDEMQAAISLAGGLMQKSVSKFVEAGQVVGLRLCSEMEENERLRGIISEIIDSYDKAIHWEDMKAPIGHAKAFLSNK